jgi:hypothetical protein
VEYTLVVKAVVVVAVALLQAERFRSVLLSTVRRRPRLRPRSRPGAEAS